MLVSPAFAELPQDTSVDNTQDNQAWQDKVKADEKSAEQFQVVLKDYYKSYIPNAEAVGTSYDDCMKQCKDMSTDCPATCRGNYIQQTATEKVVDKAPSTGYAGATTQDCYDWTDGATPDPKLKLGTKPCDGYAKQQVSDPNHPVAHGGFDDTRKSGTSAHSGAEQPQVPVGSNTKARDDARNGRRDALAIESQNHW